MLAILGHIVAWAANPFSLLALIVASLAARAVAMNRGAFNDTYTDNDGALAAIIAALAATTTTTSGVFIAVRLDAEGVIAVIVIGLSMLLSMLWAVLIGRHAGARGRHWLKWLKRAAG